MEKRVCIPVYMSKSLADAFNAYCAESKTPRTEVLRSMMAEACDYDLDGERLREAQATKKNKEILAAVADFRKTGNAEDLISRVR